MKLPIKKRVSKRPRAPVGDLPAWSLIDLHSVQDLTGGISRTTIHRLRKNEAAGFPKPVRVLKGNLRWKLGEVRAWVEQRDRV